MNKRQIIKQIVFSLILTIVVVILNKYFSFFATPCENNIRTMSYIFFTIDSIMAGFSFTVLGMLLSFHSKSFVEELKGTDIIMNKARKIIEAMIFMGISGILNLVIIIFQYTYWFEYVYIVSLVFMVLSFIHFINSMYCIYDLIKKIHIYDKQGGKPKSDLNKPNKTFQNNDENDTW